MRSFALLAAMIVLMLPGLMTSVSPAYAASSAPDFSAFWDEALVGLSGWPADLRLDAGTLSFAGLNGQRWTCDYHLAPQSDFALPLLYLVDGAAPNATEPTTDHTWLRLAIPPLAVGLPPGPDARQAELYPVILAACRALTVLCTLADTPTGHAGLIGEWRGAAVAVALGALMPDRVALICAYDPRFVIPTGRRGTRAAAAAVSGLAATYYDVDRFAASLQAPLLVGTAQLAYDAAADSALPWTDEDGGPEWLDIPAGLASPAGRRDWTNAWQAWAVALTTAQGPVDEDPTTSP